MPTSVNGMAKKLFTQTGLLRDKKGMQETNKKIIPPVSSNFHAIQRKMTSMRLGIRCIPSSRSILEIGTPA